MSHTHYYILDGHRPVPAELLEWARWFGTTDRKVRKSTLEDGRTVSTIFLGIDHNFTGGRPLLFETMVFPDCDICKRCSTWEEAEAQHEEVLASLLTVH